jgi:hypothetical protein
LSITHSVYTLRHCFGADKILLRILFTGACAATFEMDFQSIQVLDSPEHYSMDAETVKDIATPFYGSWENRRKID